METMWVQLGKELTIIVISLLVRRRHCPSSFQATLPSLVEGTRPAFDFEVRMVGVILAVIVGMGSPHQAVHRLISPLKSLDEPLNDLIVDSLTLRVRATWSSIT